MTTKKRKKTKDVQSLKRQTPKTANDLQLRKAPMKWLKFKLVTSSPDSDHLKKVKGRTSPVLIYTRADASTLLHTAVEKHGRHFKQFNKLFDYVLLYPDMSVVQNLPASNTPFTVVKYKRDLLKPYDVLLALCER